MRLLGVELTRLRWRRAVLVLLVACVAIPAVMFAAVAWDSRPVGAQEIAAAEAQAAAEAEQPYIQEQIDDCLDDPEMFGATEEQTCEQMMTPQAEWYLTRSPLDVVGLVRDLGPAVPIVLSVLLLLAGATFVGADWASGSMSNQLLFETRRTRVWAAKGGAVAVAALVTAVVVQVVFWGAVRALAGSRDLDTPSAVWDQLPGIVGRGTLLVVLAAVVGFSLTMLFRSTVATLGLLFAVVVAGTLIIAALPLGGENERWMVQTNLLAFVLNGTDYYNSQAGGTICVDDGTGLGMDCTGMSRLGLGGAATYLGTIVAVSGLLGWASFRRRDVP